MSDISYDNFDLLIERVGEGFRARVEVADRQSKRDFTLLEDRPVLSKLIEGFASLRVAQRGAGASDDHDSVRPEPTSLTQVGTALYSTVFDDDVRDALKTALERSVGPSAGLRIRLRLDEPELVGIAWELLYDPTSMRFPVLSEKTPLVRYLDLAQPRAPLPVTAPLRVLVSVSSPKGVTQLDVEKEWRQLTTALRSLIAAGKVDLDRLHPPTMGELRSRLLEGEYHVFHFIGHGKFDTGRNEGFLLFEDAEGNPKLASGDELGTWFADHFSLRLAVLNSCQGGVSSDTDPYAGVAQTLIRQGTPAVIAMQCAISDEAAITFSEGFYQALATGRPLEAAVATGRKAIRTDVSDIEWATPVLYSRLPNGSLFEIDELSPEQRDLLNDQTVLQAFWNPTQASTVTVFFGKRAAEPSEVGEVEPVVGLPYAMMVGEIRQFLARFYQQVIVTDDRDRIDPEGALVALGGPVMNPMTAAIVTETPIPVWFLGMPYTAGRERSVGTEVDIFRPQLTEGILQSDVGLGIRIRPPDSPTQFVIAGCYGAGTLGIARLLMSAGALRTFGPVDDAPRFEAVARSHLIGWDVARSELLTTRVW